MQCEAKTKKNEKCKNVALPDAIFCNVHSSKHGKCMICLNEIRVYHVLHCGHIFHRACINDWFKIQKTCPVCRRDINVIIPNSIQKELQPFLNSPDLETIIDIALNSNLQTNSFTKNITQLGFK
jgi:hypothetical protein